MVLFRSSLRRLFAALLLLTCTLLPLASPVYLSAGPGSGLSVSAPAVPDNEETRRLLEQTLSSAEIEREIVRITAEQQALESEVATLTRQSAAKQTAIADQQERAGAVVRAYYMGNATDCLQLYCPPKASAEYSLFMIIMRLLWGRTGTRCHSMKHNTRI